MCLKGTYITYIYILYTYIYNMWKPLKTGLYMYLYMYVNASSFVSYGTHALIFFQPLDSRSNLFGMLVLEWNNLRVCTATYCDIGTNGDCSSQPSQILMGSHETISAFCIRCPKKFVRKLPSSARFKISRRASSVLKLAEPSPAQALSKVRHYPSDLILVMEILAVLKLTKPSANMIPLCRFHCAWYFQ